MEDKDVLCITVQEMAKKLSVGTTTAYKIANNKNFYPAKRIGGKILISLSLLVKWLEETK